MGERAGALLEEQMIELPIVPVGPEERSMVEHRHLLGVRVRQLDGALHGVLTPEVTRSGIAKVVILAKPAACERRVWPCKEHRVTQAV